MKFDRKSLKLYAVTDRHWLNGKTLEEQVEESVKNGATFVQLREKNCSFEEFVEIAKKVKVVTDKHHVPFVINDEIDVAMAVDADGVHIGQSDENLICARKKLGDNKIIGVSVHDLNELQEAEKNGADYVGCGAVFSTNTKLDVDVMKFEKLKEICFASDMPVVAIGGISKSNLMQLAGSGIDGIAVVSAIFGAENIASETKELAMKVEEMLKND